MTDEDAEEERRGRNSLSYEGKAAGDEAVTHRDTGASYPSHSKRVKLRHRSYVMFSIAGAFYILCFVGLLNGTLLSSYIGLVGGIVTNGLAWIMFYGVDV